MPYLTIPDGEIYYEELGAGFPLLCFAPGSLRSQIGFWRHSPRNPAQPAPWMDPTADLAAHFRVIVMDQRNAGRSRARIRPTDDWQVYADDHIALLDHLNIERCHLLGACIGATFCLKLCAAVPQRIAAAVLLQPIGRVPENVAYTRKEVAESWAPAMRQTNPALDADAVSAFCERLFGADFVHSVSRELVAGCAIPLLIMPGNEVAHPAVIADELLRLAPRGEYLKFWKGEGRAYSVLCTRDFLMRNTPQ